MRQGAGGGIVEGFPLVRPSMFVSLPTRSRPSLRWATPLLFALLWLAYLWASTRSDAAQRGLLLDWGALAGDESLADTWRALWAQGRWLRLFSALFLHADWAHLLGNLIFLLIFGLPAERVMGPWRFLLLFLLGGAVAWAAHIAGFFFGVLFALFVRAAIARRLRKRRGY